MEHNYEITNLGPLTVGNVDLKIHWPLKDLNGRELTYLHEIPKIAIDNFVNDCTMDNPSLINPKRLPLQSR